jgi:hypothetical protein
MVYCAVVTGGVSTEVANMSTRTLSRSGWWWVLGATALVWIISASVAAAGTKISAATQTTINPTSIGPSDAPVRSAVLTSADRQQLKVEPARWWGGGWGWRGGYGYGAPYYSYYPAPYYYSAPAPYYTYYSPPTYYAPPTYYSAVPGPYFSYYSATPVYRYRYPRRAYWGGYYW